MAITWKQGNYGTIYGYLGKIEIGTINWVRLKNPEVKVYQFSSDLFGAVPDIVSPASFWSTPEEAQEEAAELAVAYADYIGCKVHGEEIWNHMVQGRMTWES
jgi:hypothetical protein